ncbi:MAG: DoxX family protein [Mucilaginibacter sp.]
MKSLKKVTLIILIIGYLIAGVNHFYNPASYWRIIPSYIPLPHLMNILAGTFEIIFALMMISPKTRHLAIWGISLMLIAFIPVHVDMVIRAPFILGGSFIVTPLIAWLRLLVLQPLLIVWALWYRSTDKY